MVTDLRKMQENQWLSEIQMDKSEFFDNIGLKLWGSLSPSILTKNK